LFMKHLHTARSAFERERSSFVTRSSAVSVWNVDYGSCKLCWLDRVGGFVYWFLFSMSWLMAIFVCQFVHSSCIVNISKKNIYIWIVTFFILL
jgi:hypothetical protein